jgi:hypothetical protein
VIAFREALRGATRGGVRRFWARLFGGGVSASGKS